MTYSCTEIFPLPFLSALSNSSSIALVCRRSLRLLPTMKAAMIKSTSDGTTGARLRGLRRGVGGHPHEKVPLQLVRSKIELARYTLLYIHTAVREIMNSKIIRVSKSSVRNESSIESSSFKTFLWLFDENYIPF